MLCGRTWPDKPYLTDSDIVQKSGPAKNKICTVAGIDALKSVGVILGHGKPSSKRIEDALLSHRAEGSIVVHTMGIGLISHS
ncbi:MAG: hypothetical protein DUD39_16790 [Coriobacteriaceae bacterium]|nr:MAG: hypothetical protein DUD39_16790 [Coriobacteriaceae bacterium]